MTDTPDKPDKEELRRALKAFKRKLKKVQRDDESTTGGGPLSSGKRSAICAVGPPPGFAPEVWLALCEQGRLKRHPGGTLELVPPKPGT